MKVKPRLYERGLVGVNDYWQTIEKRDKGICAKCGLDTFALRKALQYVFDRCDKGERWEWWPLTFADFRRAVGLNAYHFPNKRLYEIHHKRARANRGSDQLENLETLCRTCHLKETHRQREAGELKKR